MPGGGVKGKPSTLIGVDFMVLVEELLVVVVVVVVAVVVVVGVVVVLDVLAVAVVAVALVAFADVLVIGTSGLIVVVVVVVVVLIGNGIRVGVTLWAPVDDNTVKKAKKNRTNFGLQLIFTSQT